MSDSSELSMVEPVGVMESVETVDDFESFRELGAVDGGGGG